MPDQQRAVSESAATGAPASATRSTGEAPATAGMAPDGTSTATAAGTTGTACRAATVTGTDSAASAEGPEGAPPPGAEAAATPAAATGGTTGTSTDTASASRTRWSARALFGVVSSDGHAGSTTATAPAASDGSTPGRPRKPVLAAAAMAGALLIAVPLLVLVTSGDDDGDKISSTGSADTLLGSGDEPPGDFVASSPTAGKKGTVKSGGQKKGDANNPENPAVKGAPEPPATGQKSATRDPAPTITPTRESARHVREKDAVVQKAPADVPAVLTRVLIKNNTNSTCVDIPGAGSGTRDGRIVQSTCNSHYSDNQLWNVEQRYASAGPGGVPLFQIRNVVDSMCLDLPGYTGAGGGTQVTEYPCNGTTADNQLWWFDKQPDGKYWLRNYASNNQCLDSYDANNSVRNLFIWPCAQESRNNHEWFTTLH